MTDSATQPAPGQSTGIAQPARTSVQWLVSVRSWEEFLAVSAVAPDIIDFKEPLLGPMAATESALWTRVASSRSDSAVSLSVALGDWRSAVSIVQSVPLGIQFAKMGGEGLPAVDNLAHRLDQVRGKLLSGIELVPVAYADHEAAGSVCVESVLKLCQQFGYRRMLVDTFSKQGVSSVDHLGIERWGRFAQAARDAGVWLSLAGGISLEVAKRIAMDPVARPDCIGIRGAICGQGRASSVCPQRLAQWHAWHRAMDACTT